MSGDGWKAMVDQPRVCAGCGERVKLNSGSVWFKTSVPKRTWHWDCRPKAALDSVRP